MVYCCSFGFGRFRCFGVSCFFFSLFGVGFVYVLFVLLLVLWLDVIVFCVFCVFLFFLFLLFLFVVLCFFCCVVVFLFVLFVLFLFFGGFKGQVRWPKGPPHLALNPPFIFLFFVCLFFCFCFPFFVLNRKTLFFPPKNGHLFYLSVFPFVSL